MYKRLLFNHLQKKVIYGYFTTPHLHFFASYNLVKGNSEGNIKTENQFRLRKKTAAPYLKNAFFLLSIPIFI